MFPLRDTVKSKSFPIVNLSLIILNIFIFVYQSSLGPREFDVLFDRFGLVPASLSVFRPLRFFTFLSSMFLHGGWFHMISNMWTLFIFGDNVEDRMGSLRYLAFYVLAGLFAGLAHLIVSDIVFGPQSAVAQIPIVGASGAIAGVLGAYFLLYPRARITTLLIIVIIPWIVRIPAIIFLGLWFLAQLLPGVSSLGGEFGGIAWWAHIGGFIFGLVMVNFFARRQRTYVQVSGEDSWRN
ncbi:MAG: rhomboid family intramembrane serine protease [Chloroflexi bacterium]|nr:rhomboid family intramembrane serine protease [Chloroflexota bacterium]